MLFPQEGVDGFHWVSPLSQGFSGSAGKAGVLPAEPALGRAGMCWGWSSSVMSCVNVPPHWRWRKALCQGPFLPDFLHGPMSWTVTLLLLLLNCSLLACESMINILQDFVINSSLQCSRTKGRRNIMSGLLHLTNHFNKYLKEQRVCREWRVPGTAYILHCKIDDQSVWFNKKIVQSKVES